MKKLKSTTGGKISSLKGEILTSLIPQAKISYLTKQLIFKGTKSIHLHLISSEIVLKRQAMRLKKLFSKVFLNLI